MVQLQCNFPVPDDLEPDKTYWMVGGTGEQVDHDKMYHIDNSDSPISAEEMIERSNRKERGLILYDNCKIAELKTFIKARNPKMPASRAKKAEFITSLEAADENPDFSKFLGLPTEIRELVYSHHVRDLPTPLPELAYQPPLTLVSKQVRQESLPKGTTDQALSCIRKLKMRVSIPGSNDTDIDVASWQVNLNSDEKPKIGEMVPWKSSDYWAARQIPI